jgi:hypothetical protein
MADPKTAHSKTAHSKTTDPKTVAHRYINLWNERARSAARNPQPELD